MSHSMLLTLAVALIALESPSSLAPEADSVELGVFAGGFGSTGDLAVGGLDLSAGIASTFGGRVGYFPRWYFGLEVEGAGTLAQTMGGRPASLWDTRGSLVGQLGLWNVSPFVLLGGGALGLASRDADPSFHFGGGLKANVTQWGQLRLDARDVMAASTDGQRESHNVVVTLGVAVVLRGLPRFNPAS